MNALSIHGLIVLVYLWSRDSGQPPDDAAEQYFTDQVNHLIRNPEFEFSDVRRWHFAQTVVQRVFGNKRGLREGGGKRLGPP